MDRRGSGFKKILNSYEFQEHYTEDMKPEFRSSNSEFWLILKNLNYNFKNINSSLSEQSVGKKVPIKSADKDTTAAGEDSPIFIGAVGIHL